MKRKPLLVLMSFGLTVGILQSSQSAQALECGSCPNGFTEVTVNILAGDLAQSTAWGVAADRYFSSRAPDGVAAGGTFIISNPEDLPQVFEQVASRCRRIKQLTFFSHGSPGAVYLGDKALSSANAFRILRGVDCAMAPEARIDLSGCNSGRGCRGEDFMMQLASTLLPKRGTIRANTYYSSTPVPGVLPHTSLNGDRQILTVGPGPSAPEWDNPAMTASNCSTRSTNGAQELDTLLTQYGCRLSPTEKRNIEATRDNLRIVAATEGREGYNRVGFSSAHQRTQALLQTNYGNYEWYSAHIPAEKRSCTAPTPLELYEQGRRPAGTRAY